MMNTLPPSLAPDQLVAHRGYQKHYPENTLRSIREALAAGARHVELDVQLSCDGIPVIYHDDSLERVSGRKGRVRDVVAAELVGMSASESGRLGNRFPEERIALLSQLLPLMARYPEATFYVELKEEAVRDHGADRCLRALRQVLDPVLAQCVLISFDEAALDRARHFPRTGLVTRNWAKRDEQIAQLGVAVLFVNKTRIPAGERATAACPVVVYEVEDPAEAQQWLARGADKVETFAIGELLGKAAF